ncbi:MAG TPA: glycosyltransferase [Polyangiaceae bacterium]|nr:glycosyltransferase [Polyangiaceae bacterium]
MAVQQFILLSFGSLGDVYPFIAVGGRLARRGHRVTLISFERDAYAVAARNAGMDFVPIGSWSEVEALLASTDVNDWHRVIKIVSRVMTANLAETFEAIAERARPRATTKLVAFAPTVAARIAAERLGLPLATVHLAPAGIRSAMSAPRFNRLRLPLSFWRALAPMWNGLFDWLFDRELLEPVNAFRRSIGLPSVEYVRRALDSNDLVIGLFPDWFAPRESDWPARSVTTHFPLYDAADERPLSPELEAFLADGEPPIAFTAGSPTQRYSEFYRTSIEACAALERRGLMITAYRDDLPERLPAGIAHVEYAPFGRLLPRVAAFVHHGGIGTAAQALRAGVPQLVVPWGTDQFDNVKWLEQLGVAREISENTYRPAKVIGRLGELLSDPEVAASCRDVAARFDGVDTLEPICAALEALVPAPRAPTPSDERDLRLGSSVAAG